MAIKVIAQRREVKLGKNPGKKFVMRPDLYSPIQEKKVFAEAATHSAWARRKKKPSGYQVWGGFVKCMASIVRSSFCSGGYLGGRFPRQRQCAESACDNGHEERGGHALSADIADAEIEFIVKKTLFFC